MNETNKKYIEYFFQNFFEENVFYYVKLSSEHVKIIIHHNNNILNLIHEDKLSYDSMLNIFCSIVKPNKEEVKQLNELINVLLEKCSSEIEELIMKINVLDMSDELFLLLLNHDINLSKIFLPECFTRCHIDKIIMMRDYGINLSNYVIDFEELIIENSFKDSYRFLLRLAKENILQEMSFNSENQPIKYLLKIAHLFEDMQ